MGGQRKIYRGTPILYIPGLGVATAWLVSNTSWATHDHVEDILRLPPTQTPQRPDRSNALISLHFRVLFSPGLLFHPLPKVFYATFSSPQPS